MHIDESHQPVGEYFVCLWVHIGIMKRTSGKKNGNFGVDMKRMDSVRRTVYFTRKQLFLKKTQIRMGCILYTY